MPKIKAIFLILLLIELLIFSTVTLSQSQKNSKKFIIVLDSGHNPKNGGTRSSRGIPEVVYNDQLVSIVKNELEKIDRVEVYLTRKPQEEIGLYERTKIANQLKADLFISIHHDSAQLKYLRKIKVKEAQGYTTISSIQGYSIFVSRQNGKYQESLDFAHLLGREFRRIGRSPTHHHAEKIKGENRLLLVPDLGIYLFNELVVLKETNMPAILIEAGVIVDAEDEKFLRDGRNRKNLAGAIKRSIMKYMKP
jgi:N-acetylmuramoyl-L-alanine amidase